MCNFWSGIVTSDGRVLWKDSVWSHQYIIEQNNLKDDTLEKRQFVKVEIATKKNVYSYKPKMKDFSFMVDEAGTLPRWFTNNRVELEGLCWKEFRKAYKTDKPFNRDDIREFVKSLKEIKCLQPDGKPKKEWKMFYGDTWDAAGDAAWDAAGDAARNAAWGAAWDATRNAARNVAEDAAWYVAGDAAWDAAWYAADDAALYAAGNATRDASLMARLMLVKDLKYKDKQKHEAHVKARMEVWKKGYGLYCDVNGVLYVYAKK